MLEYIWNKKSRKSQLKSNKINSIKMKSQVLSIEGKKIKEIDLPEVFSEAYREDLVERSFITSRSKFRQPYGASKLAGRRASAQGKIHHRRRAWKGGYGQGISRVPRKVFLRRGSRFFWQGAYVPGTVKGRKAHPPKSEKIFELKINKKEKIRALKSAIAATAVREIVQSRYKNEPKLQSSITFPIIVENKLEELKKTKEISNLLKKLFSNSEQLIRQRKIRAGKGKLRGRKYKTKTGPLIIVSSKKNIRTENVDIVEAKKVAIHNLAPGGVAGRLTIYSEEALAELAKRFE